MPFPIVVGSYFEVRMFCYAAGISQVGENVFKFQLMSSIGGVPIPSQAMADAMSTLIGPLYRDLLDSGAAYAGLSVQDFPAHAWVSSWSKLGAGAGLQVGADLPSQSSGLITWLTNYAGPKGRGRTYIPFPSSVSSTAAGIPTAAYLDDLVDYADMLGNFPGIAPGGVPVIMNLVINNSKGTGTYKLVEDRKIGTFWATQRRRSRYGRTNALPAQLQ